MTPKQFWEDYFTEKLSYKNIVFPHQIRNLSSFTKDGLLICYEYPLQGPYFTTKEIGYDDLFDSMFWEIHFRNVKVRLTTEPKKHAKMGSVTGISLPEFLEVVEKLHEPRLLPLLIGIDWIAPIVSALLLKERV